MNDKQKQFITIVRLFDLTQAIIGIVLTGIMVVYAFLFGLLGFAAVSSTNTDSQAAGTGFGLFFIVLFGGIALISGTMTVLNIYLAWKLEEPKKWIWIAQVIVTCLQFLNLYYLPVNIYFLIQLLKPEYKEYYTE